MCRGATARRPDTTGCRARTAALCCLLALVCCPVCATATENLAGLSLEQAIEELRAGGLEIVYSSDLVKPWMRVREAPSAAGGEALLEEILAPYDLGIRQSPNNVLVIVRRQKAARPATGGIRGTLVQRLDRTPVQGAKLRLDPGGREAVTDAAGSFDFGALAAGAYELRSEPRSILSPYRIRVQAGETREIEVRLSPFTPPDLAEVVVSASRYELFRDTGPSASAFTAADLDLLPDIGDDGLRAVSRLPGTASIDISAKSNVRGGEVDETLVRFAGLRLYNPFHLKDFQSLFSAIDPSLIEAMNIYTGGFPVNYGDRMSSVIEIEPLAPDKEPYRELSLSFFNASALAAGNFNDGKTDWLLSARRGNLDLMFDVFEPDMGSPRFIDLHGRLGHRFSEQLAISANVLVFEDNIRIYDDDKDERAKANYRDEYYWLRFDLDPAEDLSGSVHLGYLYMNSKRRGEANQEGISQGTLNDKRDFDIYMLQSDWSWRQNPRLMFQFGGELRIEDGNYLYNDQAQFDLLFLTPGASQDPVRTTSVSTSPSGNHYGLYGNLRLNLLDWLTTEVGLRWDQETLSARDDQQLSPRASLLIDFDDQTSLRLSWGRYFQAQSVNELQASDGVTEFFPAQQADHWIASLEHDYDNGVGLRIEGFIKDYTNPRPRFENMLNTLIVLPELKPDRVEIAPQKATARGIEISLRGFEASPLTWWLSYAWSSIKDDFGAIERPRSWDQTFTYLGGIGWRGPRWEFSLSGTYHKGWPTTDAFLLTTDPIPLAGTGPRNGERMQAFRSVDLRVARKYELGDAGRLTVFGQLNNMFNWDNNCCIDYEIEADDVTGEQQLDLENKHGLPIVPSLGVTWQF